MSLSKYYEYYFIFELYLDNLNFTIQAPDVHTSHWETHPSFWNLVLMTYHAYTLEKARDWWASIRSLLNPTKALPATASHLRLRYLLLVGILLILRAADSPPISFFSGCSDFPSGWLMYSADACWHLSAMLFSLVSPPWGFVFVSWNVSPSLRTVHPIYLKRLACSWWRNCGWVWRLACALRFKVLFC